MRIRRQTLALVLGVVLPAALLGGGWLYASVRERATAEREQRVVLERAADTVRAAVDESLEELRRREDARPFYLYNYYYSPDPQDVLALSDPVVVSPLARRPDDPRVAGYFQIDPGGDVRTPYDREPGAPRTPMATRIAERIRGSAWEATRALAYLAPDAGLGNTSLAGAVASLDAPGTMNGSSTAPLPEARAPQRRRAPLRTQAAENRVPIAPAAGGASTSAAEPRARATSSTIGPVASADTAGTPSGPLTVTLGDWGNQLAREITEAQSGDTEANMRVQSRGRVAPRVERNPVTWETQVTRAGQQQSPTAQARPVPQSPTAQSTTVPQSPGTQSTTVPQSPTAQARPVPQSPTAQARPVPQSPTAQARPVPQSPGTQSTTVPQSPLATQSTATDRPPLRRRVIRRAPPTARGSLSPGASADAGARADGTGSAFVAAAPLAPGPDPVSIRGEGGRSRIRRSPLAAGDVLNAATLSEVRDHEVDYTPMRYQRVGDDWVLQRVVSHAGAASVQGLLLDEENLVTRWIPTVARRHTATPSAPRVLGHGERGACSLEAPASQTLEGIRLCFPEGALEASLAPIDRQLHLQAGLLAALLLVVGAAVFAIDRAGRRSDDLSRQKSAFIAAVSHELRTPLTTLRMHAEMLRDGLVSEKKRPRFHDDMVQESVRLSRLVENVLEISRLEEGRRPMRLVRSDLAAHVRGVLIAQERFLEAKGFALERALPDEPVEVSFDGQAVEQIVVNLLDNAVKYAATASDKVVRVSLSCATDRAVLDVLDRGPGIEERDRERVFERFARAERPGQGHVVGTGLGLSLVRELARAQGGDAVALPRDGGGACLRVWLPLGTAATTTES
ncbi:MAG: hypothetical protein IT379_23940 [Deltaproteobacteria bacterium]|nr:hypothetical protein [Deltaproteobacteria bacterium]